MLRYRWILSFRFHLFPYVLTFSSLIPAQIILSKDVKLSENSKDGMNYLDALQNCGAKDKNDMRNNVYLIKHDCGNVCHTSYESEHRLHKVSKGKYVPRIIKEYECKDLFESPLFDQPSKFLNPTGTCAIPRLDDLPKEVSKEFTYGGRVKLSFHHILEPSSSSSVWAKEQIDNLRWEFQNNHLMGSYGKLAVQEISRHLDEYMIGHINGGHILVIGSQSPWIEAVLLEKGAKHVSVLEYGEIKCAHPNITILKPDRLREMYQEGMFETEEERFDAMISFSSLEHSGLGRYGDAINPWGDLITMAKTKCIVKKNSFALVGIPSQFANPEFNEYIGFNAGRVYGSIQLSHLFANWEQVYTEAVDDYEKQQRLAPYEYQPIYILQNV